MRRGRFLLLFLVFFALACRLLVPGGPEVTRPAPPQAPSAEPFATPAPLQLAPSPTAIQPEPKKTEPTAGNLYAVRFHPDGPLYAGDQISIEVVAPPDWDLEEAQVRVAVVRGGAGAGGSSSVTEIGRAQFRRFGIGRRLQATLFWGWDTAGLPAGEYSLQFQILPEGPIWTETILLGPEAERPAGETWEALTSECCMVHFISGTAAARDIEVLLETADEQARRVSKRLNAPLPEKIELTFLPRVLGHGGFAGEGIAISYLDRNYAGGEVAMILHHEMVHWLDGRLGGELRPLILVEGLAVYLSGGHFKPEPLLPRAAALLAPSVQVPPGLGLVPVAQSGRLLWDSSGAPESGLPALAHPRYIPLTELAEDFYAAQHEIGYLEAGALVEFMMVTWGEEAFFRFYRDIHPARNSSPADALDEALQRHFGLGLLELENQFLEALQRHAFTPEQAEDVRLTVYFYDTVRRYQKKLDPSAYFRTAWLPDLAEMRERGITADLLRRSNQPFQTELEVLLVQADQALRSGNYPAAQALLEAANAILDTVSGPEARLQDREQRRAAEARGYGLPNIGRMAPLTIPAASEQR